MLYMIATGIRFLYDVFAVFVPGMWTPTGLVAFSSWRTPAMWGCSSSANRSTWAFSRTTSPVSVADGFSGCERCADGGRWDSHGLRGLVGSPSLGEPAELPRELSRLRHILDASSLSLLQIRDRPTRRAPSRAASFFTSLGHKVKILLANPNYRIFLFFHILNTVGLNVATFIIPYAQERLGVTDDQVAWLSVIYLAASAAFGTLVGKLADKTGYRSVAPCSRFFSSLSTSSLSRREAFPPYARPTSCTRL